MKNYILLLLLATFGMQAQTYQNPTYGKLKLKTNTESTTATKVNVQETDGSINWQFIKDFQNNKPYFSTGLLKNGLLTINADNTKFDLSAGIGVYSDFSDPENVTSKVFNFPAFSAVVSPYIATSNITYVAINYNGGSPILVMQAAPFSNTQMRDLVVVGAVIHSNFTTINVINNISSPSNDVGNSVADLFNFLGARNQEGNVYSANGANLQLNKSAGVILKYGANFHVNAKNPHNVSLPEQLSLTFRYRLQGGFEGTDRINVDVDNFDSNNVLTTVPPAKPYQIQTIFIPQTGQTRIQYGQTTYNTLADAIAAINTRKFNVETNLATQFVKVAYLVVKKGTTSLQVVADSDIIQASKFDATASGGVAITYQSIIDALGFVPENVANKVIDISTGANNTTYPSSLAVKTYADNLVVGMLNDRGTWDASVNLFPTTGGSGTAGAIRKGDMWYVSVAGILGGKSVNVGDSFRALVNSPAQTASNWSVLEANIGYVPENVANKTSGFSSSSTTTYPNSTALVDGLATKQSTLVSGTSIKTIEGQNILGSGNIDITKTDVELGNVDNTSDVNKPISTAAQTALNGKVSLAGAETITGVKTLSPSVSASSALARGTIVTPTLTATANNDVLVGLDVAPTFTNGAFTGISNYAAKVNGLSWFTNTIYISGPAISTNTYYRNDYIDTYGSVGFKLKSNLGGLSLNSAGTGNIDLETAGSVKGRMFNTTGNLTLQNGGIYADNGVDRVQVNGTISALPASLSNQVVVKSQLDLKANIASPTFTGTPTAPTATAGTNTTQIATTAFVTTAGNTKANISSPMFAGTPIAPTAAPGTNTNQIATTEFVNDATITEGTITTAVNITNATLTDAGRSQIGKVIHIENGATAINYTVNGGGSKSFVKQGTGTITFVQGAGRTLVAANGTLVMNGAQYSTASITSSGTKDILYINNF